MLYIPRIYAPLNLAQRSGRQPLVDIPLRYAKSVSVANVYIDAAFQIISTTDASDIFSALLLGRWPVPGEEVLVILLSWALGLRRNKHAYLHIPVVHEVLGWAENHIGGDTNGSRRQCRFRATGPPIATPSLSSSSRIYLSGYSFDDIMQLRPIMPFETAFQPREHYFHILCQWDDLALGSTQPCPTGEDAITLESYSV